MRESRKNDAEGEGECYKTLERKDVFGQMASGLFSRHRLPPEQKWIPAVSAVESTDDGGTLLNGCFLSVADAETARSDGDLKALIGCFKRAKRFPRNFHEIFHQDNGGGRSRGRVESEQSGCHVVLTIQVTGIAL